ncbi:MAG: DEAD/DEAH box helicase [Phycisphaerales bacterium JB043]
MRVVQANWTQGRLHLWAEDAALASALDDLPRHDGSQRHHPFVCDHDTLRALLEAIGIHDGLRDSTIDVRIPVRASLPIPSPHLAHASPEINGLVTNPPDDIATFEVPTISFPPALATRVLDTLEDRLRHTMRDATDALDRDTTLSETVRFWSAAAGLTATLLASQRFVPMLIHASDETIRARWQPWWSDQHNAQRVTELLASMPPAARAAVDSLAHDPWRIVEECITSIADATCRQLLADESMDEAIEDWDRDSDAHVAWLSGLLSSQEDVRFGASHHDVAIRTVRQWIGLLDDRGADVGWQLCLQLHEPVLLEEQANTGVWAPDASTSWKLSFHLQSIDEQSVMLSAEEIFATHADVMTVDGRRIESPRQVLLADLSRAARIYPKLEASIEEAHPESIELSTRDAHRFLAEIGPLLQEQGIAILPPSWWGQPASRLGVRLHIDSDDTLDPDEGDAPAGLSQEVQYHWTLAVGDTEVTVAQLEQLAKGTASLIRVEGRWVELRPQDIAAAARFLRDNPGGEQTVGDLMRIAFASDISETGVEVTSVNATGWVAQLLGLDDGESSSIDTLGAPDAFVGTLRPYQLRGLSWIWFLERFGLGACLADDMGLGKTIQILALLQQERQQFPDTHIGPSLVVAPMSVVGNWRREAQRFAPELRVIVHHGIDRPSGDAFVAHAEQADLVITTYTLAYRDEEDLKTVKWRRIVLDEAQSVKNPNAKQSKSVRSLSAPRRLALTGTPVENRLSELWSIMDFCNPGYLGGGSQFKRRFSTPIERRHDKVASEQLRNLVRPFILRRLKTDPNVITDLPRKVESKEYCPLTSEQAKLYERTVNQMLTQVDQAQGIQRRGAVLATLVKLKQICNHPAHAMGEDAQPFDPARSGKASRILEMLDEALAAGDQALIFTQFREMGHILVSMLTRELDREVLFLHGGTTQAQREAMIDRFQLADGTAPIFVLSLKAGGLGMNLTAANHVFHYDRWWNPAVENQATDRAYRIGQTRTVQVHKFIVAGTLEERIDEMIELKTELAENIIGSGEQWLTELSTEQLHDLLSLRQEALVE